MFPGLLNCKTYIASVTIPQVQKKKLLPIQHRCNELTNNGKDHYGEIKHIPPKFKVVEIHGDQPNNGFYDEDAGEDVVQVS